MLELEQHVEVAGFLVGQVDGVFGGRHGGLADGQDVVLGQHLALHLTQELHQAWAMNEVLSAPLVAVCR